MKQLFPAQLQTPGPNKPSSTIDQRVITLQIELVCDLLQTVEELKKLRSDLESSQAERVQTQAHCRELMSKLTECDGGGLDSHGRQLNDSGDDDRYDCNGSVIFGNFIM